MLRGNVGAGWQRTAFGQRRWHFFLRGAWRPVCGSTAAFTTARPVASVSYGRVCPGCMRKYTPKYY